jgi:hypothetical protein
MIQPMLQPADSLWNLAQKGGDIDPADLAPAIESAVADPDLDNRTRTLIQESLSALEKRWGLERFEEWLYRRPHIANLRTRNAVDPNRFPSLTRRVVETTKPDKIERFLRDLSMHVSVPTDLYIGGSIALILAGRLSRHTEDIDLVDEIPASIRSQPQMLDELARVHDIYLAHFQSHYLPTGWRDRVRSLGVFGTLRVFVVDEIDIFLSKLFSNREKDRQDLRIVADKLDRETLVRRIRESTQSLQDDSKLREAAERNWFVLFGDALPSAGSGT